MRYHLPMEILDTVERYFKFYRNDLMAVADRNEHILKTNRGPICSRDAHPTDQTFMGKFTIKSRTNKECRIQVIRETSDQFRYFAKVSRIKCEIDNLFNLYIFPCRTKHPLRCLLHEAAHVWIDSSDEELEVNYFKPLVGLTGETLKQTYACLQEEFDAEGCVVNVRLQHLKDDERKQLESWVKDPVGDIDWLSTYIRHWMLDEIRRPQFLEALEKGLQNAAA